MHKMILPIIIAMISISTLNNTTTRTPIPVQKIITEQKSNDSVQSVEQVSIHQDDKFEPYFSDEDIEYIYRCIETEVYGADVVSKSHVARVIINRILSDKYPNTGKAVVTQPNQFAYFRVIISDSTKEAFELALKEDCVYGALYFHSNNYSETFSGKSHIFTDDVGHHFY